MTKRKLDVLAKKLADGLLIPRWMNIRQAARYSNIGQKKLISLVQAGEIYGFQDLTDGTKPWIIDQQSIDQYRYRQGQQFDEQEDKDNKIALEIVQNLRL